jgi:hypothetical protein
MTAAQVYWGTLCGPLWIGHLMNQKLHTCRMSLKIKQNIVIDLFMFMISNILSGLFLLKIYFCNYESVSIF